MKNSCSGKKSSMSFTSVHLALEGEVDHIPGTKTSSRIGDRNFNTVNLGGRSICWNGRGYIQCTASQFSVLKVKLLEVAKVLTDVT